MGPFNFIYRFIHRDRIFVKDIIKRLKNIKNPIVLEAGVANGIATIKFSKLLPNGQIYDFKPVELNFLTLKEKLKHQNNVRLFKLALGDYNGKNTINISHNNTNSEDNIASSSSLLKPKRHSEFYPYITFDKQEEIEVCTIDTWATDNHVDHIDAMWLDMQGMEFATLKASPEIMKTVRVVYSEVNFVETYEGCALYEEYSNWLFSLGFELKKTEFLCKDQGNALFVRKTGNYQ